MEKTDTIKIALIVVFFGILISGMFITVNNYRKWNSVKTSITAEYRRAEPVENDITLDDQNTNDITDQDINNSDNITEQNSENPDNTTEQNNNKPDNATEQESSNPDDATGQESNNPDDTADQDENPENNTETEENTDQGNAADEDSGTENAGRQETNMEGFYITEITDDIFARIQGKSFPDSCTVAREQLRYVHIRHYGFEGEIRDGELIVNAAIAQDVLEIFEELYDQKYQIERVRLIDEYDADDEKSMEANNSSCFNYRTIAESSTLSNHAYGRAIDINPFYNPYVYTRSDGSLFLQPKGSEKYVDRTVDAACIIRKGDVCYNAFIKHGFKWGGDWETKKDYQHFEKTD